MSISYSIQNFHEILPSSFQMVKSTRAESWIHLENYVLAAGNSACAMDESGVLAATSG